MWVPFSLKWDILGRFGTFRDILGQWRMEGVYICGGLKMGGKLLGIIALY